MEGQLSTEIHTAEKTKICKKGTFPIHLQSFASLPKKISMMELMVKPPLSGERFRSNSARNPYAASIIPKEAIGKEKESLLWEEPTSPEVTCIGQIKSKHEERCKGTSYHRKDSREKDQIKWPTKYSEKKTLAPSLHIKKLSRALKRFFLGITRGAMPGPSDMHFDDEIGAHNSHLLHLRSCSSSMHEPHSFANLFDDNVLDMNPPEQSSSTQDAENYKILYQQLREAQYQGRLLSYSGPAKLEDEKEEAILQSDSIVFSSDIKVETMPKPKRTDGPTQINLWKRRSVPPLKALELEEKMPHVFEGIRPLST